MIEWYPVGWVVFGLALGAGAVGAAGLYVSAPSLEKLQELADRTVAQLVESGVALPGGNEQIDEEARGKLATFFTMFWSSALASAWFWIILLNLYFGARVAHASGLLARPWPNLSMIAMPRYAGLLLAVTFALAFWNILPLYERLLVSAFATTLLLAFLLVGLAIVHNVTWGQPLRPFILVAVYAFLLFFNPISGFAIATLALAEPLWRLRHPGKGHQDPTQPPQ